MTFKNLEEFRNYVPNCVVCGKEMEFIFSGANRISDYYDSYRCRRYDFVTTIKVKYNNGILTNFNEDFCIDVNSNKILKLNDKIRQSNYIKIIKACWTCDFTLDVISINRMSYTNNILPKLHLFSEILVCYLKNRKKLSILNSIDTKYINQCAIIYYDNKLLPFNMYFDFTKYNNLKKIKNAINMIKTFQ